MLEAPKVANMIFAPVKWTASESLTPSYGMVDMFTYIKAAGREAKNVKVHGRAEFTSIDLILFMIGTLQTADRENCPLGGNSA